MQVAADRARTRGWPPPARSVLQLANDAYRLATERQPIGAAHGLGELFPVHNNPRPRSHFRTRWPPTLRIPALVGMARALVDVNRREQSPRASARSIERGRGASQGAARLDKSDREAAEPRSRSEEHQPASMDTSPQRAIATSKIARATFSRRPRPLSRSTRGSAMRIAFPAISLRPITVSTKPSR
jgi:hypothetical protein